MAETATAAPAAANAFTTIKIVPSSDGQSYTMSIVEPEAKNGKRIDHYVARWILQADGNMKQPQFQQMMQQSRQNPMGFLQGMMQNMMANRGGNPMMGGFNPMGFMGR